MKRIFTCLLLVFPILSFAENYSYKCSIRNPELFNLNAQDTGKDPNRYHFVLSERNSEKTFNGTAGLNNDSTEVVLKVRASGLLGHDPKIVAEIKDFHTNDRLFHVTGSNSLHVYYYAKPGWDNAIGVECELQIPEKKSSWIWD